MRFACLLALALVAAALVPSATARQRRALRPVAADTIALATVLERIAVHRDETWRWQEVMHRSRTPYSRSVVRVRSLPYRKWVLKLWQRRALAAKELAFNPPHKRDWLCIHRYEGSWKDANAPYYGGLQMDLAFQATYGPRLLHRKGTAEHWTPLEQMWVAERAYRARGFWPWPNTAKFCGLI